MVKPNTQKTHTGIKREMNQQLVDAIGKIIVNKPDLVRKMLINRGVRIKRYATPKELVKYVAVQNKIGDKVFQKMLSKAVINSGYLGSTGYDNGDGEGKIGNFFKGLFGGKGSDAIKSTGGDVAGNVGGGATGVVSSVAGMIGSIFGFAKSGQERKAQADKSENDLLLATINAKMQKDAIAGKGKMLGKSMTFWIVMSIVIMVVIVIVIVVYKKVKAK